MLYLHVANVSYVPEAPEVLKLRSRELRVYEQSTPECDEQQWDLCLRSMSTFDRFFLPVLWHHCWQSGLYRGVVVAWKLRAEFQLSLTQS